MTHVRGSYFILNLCLLSLPFSRFFVASVGPSHISRKPRIQIFLYIVVCVPKSKPCLGEKKCCSLQGRRVFLKRNLWKIFPFQLESRMTSKRLTKRVDLFFFRSSMLFYGYRFDDLRLSVYDLCFIGEKVDAVTRWGEIGGKGG